MLVILLLLLSANCYLATVIECSGPNEYYACGGGCDNVCAELHIQSQDNCPIRNIKCNDMCYCDRGYARDAKGICVPISECPKIKRDKRCPFPNELYMDCKQTCPPDSCIAPMIRCVPSDNCEPGCFCLPGYLRQAKGQPCIPQCQCKELARTSLCNRDC